MLKRSGLKPESFISAIACTIGRNENCRKDAEDLTYDALEQGDRVLYLGNGYWRAQPVWTDDQQLYGVRLVNPDRSPAEVAAVERGIAVLCYLEYVP